MIDPRPPIPPDEEVIDLEEVLTDIKDIPVTDADTNEQAYWDSFTKGGE